MRLLRQSALVLLALLLIAAVWLWLNRPQKVDMAAYAPADSLVFLEANSLPAVVEGLVSTDAWKALAPAAGIRSGAGQIGWLSRLSAWTGIGTAESVVFSRSQVAVVILGFDAADAGETLKIKPRLAVVVETHTGEGRTRDAVEKLASDFARRTYGQPSVKTEESGGLKLMTWTAPGGERRIVAAVTGSVAVIGNDEATVRACLAVRRGERPGLAGNAQLEEMRSRLEAGSAAAFGYVSPAGASKIVEFAATAYAGQLSDDARAQSVAASLLVPLANKVVGGGGWSSHFTGGGVEDRYFVTLQNGVDARLRDPLTPAQNPAADAGQFLPAGTYSLSRYTYRDPAAAWKGMTVTLSSQGGVIEYGIITRLFNEALKPYGIDEPEAFLRSIGQEIVTARLDDRGESTVTLVQARDEKALRDFVSKRMGAKPRTERVGSAEMIVSRAEERGAATFLSGHLLMGSARNVRRCLESLARGAQLSSAESFRRAAGSLNAGSLAGVVTFTADDRPARALFRAVGSQRIARERAPNEAEVERAASQLPYSVSETRLVEGGFEKRTRSSFGQFGTLVVQLVPER